MAIIRCDPCCRGIRGCKRVIGLAKNKNSTNKLTASLPPSDHRVKRLARRQVVGVVGVVEMAKVVGDRQ